MIKSLIDQVVSNNKGSGNNKGEDGGMEDTTTLVKTHESENQKTTQSVAAAKNRKQKKILNRDINVDVKRQTPSEEMKVWATERVSERQVAEDTTREVMKVLKAQTIHMYMADVMKVRVQIKRNIQPVVAEVDAAITRRMLQRPILAKSKTRTDKGQGSLASSIDRYAEATMSTYTSYNCDC